MYSLGTGVRASGEFAHTSHPLSIVKFLQTEKCTCWLQIISSRFEHNKGK